MNCEELMDESIFNFDDASDVEDCVENISWLLSIKIQKKRLKQLALKSPPHNIRPLKNLTLNHNKVFCSEAINCDPSTCFANFLPHIAEQLREHQKTFHIQELAWPHLLQGRSAIIIDPSDSLADLVYLPVVCSHVNKASMQAKRYGPLAIIICKNENRCIDVAKRCISFSPNGYMATRSVCVLYGRNRSLIFVTTTSYIMLYGLPHSRNCDSVQQIVIDGMENSLSDNQFEKMVLAMQLVSNQVIITSKIWRRVLTKIRNNVNRSNDFVIIGSPLDIAIAADTKFDIMFTKTSHEYTRRLELILEKVKNVFSEKILILCDDRNDLTEIRTYLERAHIQSNCVETRCQNNELHKFEYAGKDVYFGIRRMLTSPPNDLSRFSYYFVYKVASNADLSAIDNTCIAMYNRFVQNIKPDQWYLEPSNRATVALFHNFDDKARTMELSKYFLSYHSVVRCRRFWSHVSVNNLLVAVRNHLQI